MSRLEGFPPIAAANAHTLILGSMPGAASLAAGEYYAHPRNSFWAIVDAVLGIDAALPYAERARQLVAQGYALWDVLGACRRTGSLDARIEADSIEVNDFGGLFATHPHIARVFFNGSTAETCFRRHVVPILGKRFSLVCHRLPSTSPANASITAACKRAAWQAIARSTAP